MIEHVNIGVRKTVEPPSYNVAVNFRFPAYTSAKTYLTFFQVCGFTDALPGTHVNMVASLRKDALGLFQNSVVPTFVSGSPFDEDYVLSVSTFTAWHGKALLPPSPQMTIVLYAMGSMASGNDVWAYVNFGLQIER